MARRANYRRGVYAERLLEELLYSRCYLATRAPASKPRKRVVRPDVLAACAERCVAFEVKRGERVNLDRGALERLAVAAERAGCTAILAYYLGRGEWLALDIRELLEMGVATLTPRWARGNMRPLDALVPDCCGRERRAARIEACAAVL